MTDRRTYIGLVWMAQALGCYQPQPSEGAPCSDEGTCPTGLSCFAGHCLAEPPPIDARSVDTPAPVDGPSVNCADALCDGFESGTLAMWTVSRSDPSLTVAVSTARVHSGTYALDSNVPAQNSSGQSAYAVRHSAAQTTGALTARVWINAPQAITGFSSVLRFGSQDTYAIVAGDSQSHWTVTELSSKGLFDHTSKVATVQDTWTCVELDYTFTPTPHMKLYIDDALVIDLDAADPAPSYTDVGIGVARAPLGGFRVFADDIVIADKHIGCN
jgi:hypothetical protein